MAASVIKFDFKIMGETREEVTDALEEAVAAVILKEGGEPWVSIQEVLEKQMVNEDLALSGDPRGFIWVGARTAVFTGPTKIGMEAPTFRDGFRPQEDGEQPRY